MASYSLLTRTTETDRKGYSRSIVCTFLFAGDWKVARTRSLENLRYVAQAFLPAGYETFQSRSNDAQRSQN